MNVPVLTISNRIPHEPYYFYEAFLKSCARQGFEPIFLGGKPEPGKRNPLYRGLMSKPRLLLQWLKEHGAQYETVIVCDAFDIIWLTTPQDVAYNWKAFGDKIVFNAERNCFPDGTMRARFNEIGGPIMQPYRFLNSGFFIGQTDAIVEMLNWMKLDEIPDDTKKPDGTWENFNDQLYYQRYFLDEGYAGKATLDYQSILCQSLHDAEEREFAFDPDRERVISLLTHNEPCIIHGNGSGKAWLERIIRWLNL